MYPRSDNILVPLFVAFVIFGAGFGLGKINGSRNWEREARIAVDIQQDLRIRLAECEADKSEAAKADRKTVEKLYKKPNGVAP